jgi:hypothetical protein
MDTHSQSIRTDPEIYLPGEVNTREVDTDSEDSDSNDICDDSNGDSDEYDDGENEDVSNVYVGMKRKITTRSRKEYPAKIAKTITRASTAARNVIDDRHPSLTLIDTPVGESVLPHPYGRHSCLYIEIKADANKKPNPQNVVCPLFLVVPHYDNHASR